VRSPPPCQRGAQVRRRTISRISRCVGASRLSGLNGEAAAGGEPRHQRRQQAWKIGDPVQDGSRRSVERDRSSFPFLSIPPPTNLICGRGGGPSRYISGELSRPRTPMGKRAAKSSVEFPGPQPKVNPLIAPRWRASADKTIFLVPGASVRLDITYCLETVQRGDCSYQPRPSQVARCYLTHWYLSVKVPCRTPV